MDIDLDWKDLENSILSTDLPTQAEALARIQGLMERLLELAVEGFAQSVNPMIYADRLSLLGTVTIPHLRRAMERPLSGETRFQGAALLLFLGDHTYVADVLTELKTGGRHELLAANKLARAGVAEAGGLIVARLETIPDSFYNDSRNSAYVQAMVCDLALLGLTMPRSLLDRIKASEASKYVVFPEGWD